MTTTNNTEMNSIDLLSEQSGEFSTGSIVELSEQDLDISGGTGFNLGDVGSFGQKSGNFFSQKNLSVGQATFAGPGGSGTISQVDFQQIDSGAFQDIAFGK